MNCWLYTTPYQTNLAQIGYFCFFGVYREHHQTTTAVLPFESHFGISQAKWNMNWAITFIDDISILVCATSIIVGACTKWCFEAYALRTQSCRINRSVVKSYRLVVAEFIAVRGTYIYISPTLYARLGLTNWSQNNLYTRLMEM